MERLGLFILAGFFTLVSNARAATSALDFYQQGNAAYGQSQFAQAVSAYESARTQGLSNWLLYYNLGNAYYKNGQTGKAIANYERAFRLNSSQGDLIFNLNFALTKVGDPLLPNGALARLLWRLFFNPSLNLLTILVSFLFIGLCGGGVLVFLKGYKPPAELALGLITGLLTLSLWLGFRIALINQHEAVVIIPIAEVRSGPNTSYTANFTVPEGRRVLLLDEQEPIKGWMEIGIPSEGLKGWVPDSAVEPL